MALSQIQCLDDNHVNPRTHESKPEFLYCEDQRLALEVLLLDGREAFFKYLEARGLRGFLSDPELESLAGSMEPYDPNTELFPEGAEDDEPPLSLHYWPELSDTSIPQMDLGWPDCEAYRGVTRTTVYAQPPLDGQAHIKEVVRKMIAQAQKVIAVVMDVFTDVDIFRDLLDAGFKRRVSVYILLERSTLPHFLSMCQRANMHAGHLKHLRVRCTEGVSFYTRSSSKVRGRMGHRFMFIDGDKAVSGSYSFTWMSSRLERNLITVVTGQAVDTFDRLFRVLYSTSSSVDLRKVATEPEPEPEPLPQIASVVPTSAAVARKLYNPKYALALGNPSPSPSPTPPADNDPEKTQSQDNTKNQEVPETKKRKRRRASKEAIQEAPPIHPGLIDLEKACMMLYLPTWPEPDPPSDVIGFINIRDSSKPTPVHLQRSEMFGTSQAIRFSSPFSMPKETLPEVAMPRQFTAKHEELNKLQQETDKTKAEKSLVDPLVQPAQLNAQPGDTKSKVNSPGTNLISWLKFETDKHNTKTLNTEDKLHSNTPDNQDPAPQHHTTSDLSAHAPQSSSKASSPTTERPSVATNPNPDFLHGSSIKKQKETSLNMQSAVVYRTYTLESHSTQSSNLRGRADSNPGQHMQTQMVLPHTDLHTQLQNTSEVNQTPTVKKHVSPSSISPKCSESVSSTSVSETNHVSIATTTTTTSACTPLSSISSTSPSPPLTYSSTTLNHPLSSSSTPPSLTPTPPIPKPRTVQLVIKDSVISDDQKLLEFSVVKRLETSMGPQVVHNSPTAATRVQILPEKEPETVPELQNSSESKTKTPKNTGNVIVAPQQIQSGTFQETRNEEEFELHDDRAGMQLVAETKLEALSDVLITDATKTDSVWQKIPKDVEPQTLTSIDCKVSPQIDCAVTVQTEAGASDRVPASCESAGVPDENRNNVTQGKTYHANALDIHRSYRELTPKDLSVLETVDSLKASTHTPNAATHNSHMSKDIDGDITPTSAVDAHDQQGNLSHTQAKSMSNASKQNPHSNIQELTTKARGGTNTPERPLRLHLSETHIPDFRSPTPERESRTVTAFIQAPTPDGFLQRTPTPDSRTQTPDFRTSTSDVSDEYVSPRPESALSTTSEEYYECSDCPSQECAVDQASYRNHVTTEDHVRFILTNKPNTTSIATSPSHVSYTAATQGTTDRNTSNSETQSLSRPSSVSSTSSLLERKIKMEEEEEETTNEENEREVDEKGKRLSVAETRTDSCETHRRGSEEAERTADHFRQSRNLTEIVERNKDAQPQTPKKKRVLNQSGAVRLVDGVATPGKLTNEGAELKRLSTGDLKPKKVSSAEERPDKEKVVDRGALGPSSVERRGRPQSTRETEAQKRMRTPPRAPRGQPHDSKASSPSRLSRPTRLLSANQPSGARPSGSRQLSQTESKALQSSFQGLDIASSPRRPPSRPPPPMMAGAVGSTTARKQTEVSQSQQTFLPRQARTRAGQSPSRHSYPKSPSSFLHTHANMLPAATQHHSHSQNQTVSSQEDGKAPFSFTFSRLYSLKGLKDKMNKLPAQSKKSSSSSPVQGRKSTG